jgi:hypothetical protein
MENQDSNNIDALKGGIGCDLVTGTGAFHARIGKIYCAVSNANASRILSIVEIRSNIGASVDKVTVTSRSYLGAVDFNDNKFIIFDNPVETITLSAGSIWVFYQNK